MASRDCLFFLHFCTQNEKNVTRTVGNQRVRRRRDDTHGAKTTCSSTHNTHILCANRTWRPSSRQHARLCRSKTWGVSACPQRFSPEGNGLLVIVILGAKKACTGTVKRRFSPNIRHPRFRPFTCSLLCTPKKTRRCNIRIDDRNISLFSLFLFLFLS